MFNTRLKGVFRSFITDYEDSNQLWAQKEQIKEFINVSVIPNIREIRSRAIFSQINNIESELRKLRSNLSEEMAMPLGMLHSILERFSDHYEELLHNTSITTALQLLDSAEDFSRTISDYENLADLVERLLQQPQQIKIGYEKISIVLPTTLHYRQILIKLAAIEDIYSELCNLIGVSPSEFPLEVGKVEVGSLWVKLFGESKVITLLTKLIESSAAFVYRNFTVEGKVQTIPKQVESIESVIHLSQQLEEMGIDTSQIKENLQKSAVTISNKLNDLLLGEPSIKINDKQLSVSQALEEKFLAGNRGLFLESGAKEEKQ